MRNIFPSLEETVLSKIKEIDNLIQILENIKQQEEEIKSIASKLLNSKLKAHKNEIKKYYLHSKNTYKELLLICIKILLDETRKQGQVAKSNIDFETKIKKLEEKLAEI
ncbi:hypothetical protein C0583_06675 [Candidatus Parcubacteria bacterium]|nr:MAG: hypothetical protein C0583_06675 [Candidatus Parcubacteria bacterium]